MKKRLSIVLCLALWFFAPFTTVSASSAEQRLNRFYQHVKSMRADFTQKIVSETRPDVQKSQGVLEMQRPGKFRWNYSAPYAQVIVKPLGLALGNTPAVLLSGGADITDQFTVTQITENRNSDKSLFWIQLVPRDENAGFEKLLLAFSGDKIQIMELKDAFGQVTRLTFSNMQINPDIDPADFNFNVPPGVDVINETEKGAE
jgi:outer membrane lipoprotein carrier protein